MKTRPSYIFALSGLVLLTFSIVQVNKSYASFDNPSPPTGSGQLMQYQYIGPLNDEDMNKVAGIGEAGRAGKRAEIPSIIAFLQSPPHYAFVMNGLHALAQMGATEGLPEFDAYINENPGFEQSNFALVEKARLLAESEAHSLTGSPAQAATKVRRFLAELKLTPTTLNQAPLTYTRTVKAYDRSHNVHLHESQPITSVEVFALRALADMVYRGTYADFASLPEIASVSFARDTQSALKMRLAPLPRAVRISTMIEELAHKQILRASDDYVFQIQLLINEGFPAGRLVAAKIEQMDAHREQYPENGFRALFKVLMGLGDKAHTSLAERFRNQSAAGDVIYYDIRAGIRREKIAAY